MSGFAVSYVALACEDVQRVATVLGDTLALTRLEALPGGARPAAAFAVGTTALGLFAADDPSLDGEPRAGVRHVAFAASDPGAACAALGLEATADGAERRVDPAASGGLRLRFAPPFRARPCAGPVVERIDHLGVASADNAAAHALFHERMGCAVESTQTDMEVRTAIESFTSDKYGVVYHSRTPEPIGGLRVSFITVGDFELEFLQPFDPGPASGDEGAKLGTVPGNTAGDRGAIGRYIDRRGPGLHHVALKTPDIDATLARLDGAGLRVIDRVGRPGSRRARIGFVHPSALGGLLLHFVERDA